MRELPYLLRKHETKREPSLVVRSSNGGGKHGVGALMKKKKAAQTASAAGVPAGRSPDLALAAGVQNAQKRARREAMTLFAGVGTDFR